MTELVHLVVRFAEAHAGLVYLLAFFATALESIAVVGLLVPGSAIIVALGALVPSGAIGFWWLSLWSVLGALVGDGASYWIGRWQRDRVERLPPIRRHPRILAHARRFFEAHGAKSVFLSRFVAPVRGTVPLVAGMAGMASRRFFVTSAISALGWAPAHIVPGVLIGAGLTLTNAVATRLLLLVVVLSVFLWVVTRLAIIAVRRGGQELAAAQQRVEGWARSRDVWLARQVLALLDPARAEARTLAILGILLAAAAATFFGVLEDVFTGDPLVRADAAIYNMLQGLRSLPGDRIMIAVTELGGATVVGATVAVVLCWLFWRRAWHAIAYWLAAVAGATVLGAVLKLVLHRPRPVPMAAGWDAFSFPSGHATTSAAVYGFLAVVLARDAPPASRALIVGTTVLAVSLIGFSRIYLGAHWFSDVIGGIAFGTAWIATLAIAYVRHDPPRLPAGRVAATVVSAIVVTAGFQVAHRMPADLERYATKQTDTTMPAAGWWRDGWRAVPQRRIDLSGEREDPLILQWAGRLGDLRGSFVSRGWRRPAPWSLTTAQSWLGGAEDPLTLPVLPRLHDGRGAALTLIHAAGPGRPADGRWVLRVWDAGMRLSLPAGGTRPLWVAAVTLQRFHRAFAPFDLGFERGGGAIPWALLKQGLQTGARSARLERRGGGAVMLASEVPL